MEINNNNINDNCLLCVGVIADIQYCPNEPNGRSGWGKKRYYKDSINKVKKAVEYWNNYEEESNNIRIEHIFNLGDTIDRHCSTEKKGKEALMQIVNEFDEFKNPSQVYSVIGNHDLYVLQRETVKEILNIPNRGSIQQEIEEIEHYNDYNYNNEEDIGYDNDFVENISSDESLERCYYDVKLNDRFRAICLDTYDVGLAGRDSSHYKIKLGKTMLKNGRKNHKSDNHFCDLNGGVDRPQLQWLRNKLFYCQMNNEKVVIFTHSPFYPPVAYACRDAVCWNYRDLLSIIHEFDDVVVLNLYGHEHEGGQAIDTHNIHHVALKATLEANIGTNSFVILKFYENRLILEGYGNNEGNLEINF